MLAMMMTLILMSTLAYRVLGATEYLVAVLLLAGERGLFHRHGIEA